MVEDRRDRNRAEDGTGREGGDEGISFLYIPCLGVRLILSSVWRLGQTGWGGREVFVEDRTDRTRRQEGTGCGGGEKVGSC